MKRLVSTLLAALLLLVACASAEEERGLPDVELELLDGGTYDLTQTGDQSYLSPWTALGSTTSPSESPASTSSESTSATPAPLLANWSTNSVCPSPRCSIRPPAYNRR